MSPTTFEPAKTAATASAIAGKVLRSFLRTPQLIATTLGQGVLFLLVFRYVFGGAIDTGPLAYVDYMVPGIVTAGILFAAAGAAVGGAEDRADGFTDRLLSLPSSRTGIVVGRLIADTMVGVGSVTIMLVVAFAVGFRPHASALTLAAAASMLVAYAVAFAALFGALGSFAQSSQAAQGLGFVAIPLTFVSSAYVPTDSMPTWLATLANHQPVTHLTDALRTLTQAQALGHDRPAVFLALLWAASITLGASLLARHRLAHR